VIPKDCKRLAEVDFPIAEVSRHAAREKSIRHGHPSTLHLWWARRPMASSRAVLLALLWPDPCEALCPAEFKAKARELLPQVGGCDPGTTDEDLRKGLLKFIANFANWDNGARRTYLEVSCALVKAAYGKEPPLVVDPFAGGGSIPLEALRLGCEAFASDLNPVACLILKVMLEDIPRHGSNLAAEVRLVGSEIEKRAEKELADLYPKDPDGASPLVYFWARTVRCESPNCGTEIPLVRSFWLCTSPKRQSAIRYKVVAPRKGEWALELEVFAPRSAKEVPNGTISQAKATCPRCGGVMPKDRLRAQLLQQDGGADVRIGADGRRIGGALLLAKLVRKVNGVREYRAPAASDYEIMASVRRKLDPTLIPTETIEQERVAKNSPFRVHLYGMRRFSNIFTARQIVALQVYSKAIGATVPEPLAGLFACVSSRCADYWSSCVVWAKAAEFVAHTFGRQALSIVWDFAETVPISDSSGNFSGAVDWVARVAEALSVVKGVGQVEQLDASRSSLPSESADVWFTDPPYYDAVSYADLSDYFFVWLKKQTYLKRRLSDPFDPSNPLTPKAQEAIQDEFKVYAGVAKTGEFYENKMKEAFREGTRVVKADGVGCVVFAHKTTEGWEALLSGMISGGWTITGSWPIATERPGRLRSQESAALATSVHLICRPRREAATVGDWAKVLGELPARVGDSMERFQAEGVRGADLVFACIGPALEIFSRYSKVETADGRDVPLAEYLEKVWEVVGRSALAQVLGTAEAKARNGAAGAVEEDARLTALFLWTLQSTNHEVTDAASDEEEDEEPPDEDDEEEGSSRGKAKGFTLVFDVVRRFAQPLGIDLPKWEGRVIETKKGVVRLLPIKERAKQLFGDDGAQAVAARLEQAAAVDTNPLQGMLFPDLQAAPKVHGRGRGRGRLGVVEVSDESLAAAREATTLDRVHAAMLLQAGGRTNALRALLKAEQERGADFLRLANAFSALYPKGSEEKRLIDAMLLAVPR
jgi:adenine-specific DNA methylase